jgi:hypothetical protein
MCIDKCIITTQKSLINVLTFFAFINIFLGLTATLRGRPLDGEIKEVPSGYTGTLTMYMYT